VAETSSLKPGKEETVLGEKDINREKKKNSFDSGRKDLYLIFVGSRGLKRSRQKLGGQRVL